MSFLTQIPDRRKSAPVAKPVVKSAPTKPVVKSAPVGSAQSIPSVASIPSIPSVESFQEEIDVIDSMPVKLNVPATIPTHLQKLKIYPHLQKIVNFITSDGIDDVKCMLLHLGTGSGKTAGTGQAVMPFLLNTDKKLFISVPLIANAKSMWQFACENMPEFAQYFAYRAGNTDSGNLSTARVIYATTQSVFQTLARMYKEKTDFSKICIMVDEAHHTSEYNTGLLALTNWYLGQFAHTSFRAIVATATPIDDVKFDNLLKCVKIENAETQHPVKINYVLNELYLNDNKLTDKICGHVRKIVDMTRGNMLVFVSGSDEVTTLVEQLGKMYPNCTVLGYHGSMQHEEQLLVHKKYNNRVIIVATNALESGITLDVSVVVDSGLCKTSSYKNGISSLDQAFISQMEAKQRSGRCGRLGPGVCYRLYTEVHHNYVMKVHSTPQFDTMPKEPLILVFLKYGLPAGEILNIDPCEYGEIIKYLISMGLYDGEKKCVTPLANEMQKYPLDLATASMLVHALQDYRGDDAVLMMIIASAINSRLSGSHYYIPAHVVKGLDGPQKTMARKQFISDNYDNFVAEDDIQSLLKVVLSFMVSVDSLRDWCKKNFIQEKFLKSFLRNFRAIYYGRNSNRDLLSDPDVIDTIIPRLYDRVKHGKVSVDFYRPYILKGFPRSVWTGYMTFDNMSLNQYGFRIDNTAQNGVDRTGKVIALACNKFGKTLLLSICIPGL
jgi:HrpA-like RNA helicase